MQENVKVMIDKSQYLESSRKVYDANLRIYRLTGDQSRLLFVIKEHGHSQKEVGNNISYYL